MRYLAPLLFWTACTGGIPTPPPPPPSPPAVPTAVVVRGLALVPGDNDALALIDTRLEIIDGVIHALAPAPQASTEIPDAYGDMITPGWVDAHAHLEGLGRQTAELDLVGLLTYKAVLEAIDAHAKAAPPGSWIGGRGWDQNDWPDAPDGGWPTADDLDSVSHGHAVALRRVDGHASWANHAALLASGIDDDDTSPAGGQLLRNKQGALIGVLVDNAADLLAAPQPTIEQRRRWVHKAQDIMLSSGLTGLHDMGTHDDTLAILRDMDDKGELIIRVWSYLPAGSAGAKKLLETGPQHGRHLDVVGIKAYADGALGSRGALLSAPYSDRADHHGLAVMSKEHIEQLADRCLRARVQLAVHAIGDKAVHDVLDAFASARSRHPDAGEVRLRIEHAQVVQPGDMPRFAELNTVASVQPTHATSDMPWAQDRLGPERIEWSYAWRDLRDHHAPLALGSDFPVESVDPRLGLWAATRRTTLAHEPPGGWRVDQALTQIETLGGFTRDAAWAAQAESQHGTLAVGRAADLVLWRKDIRPPDWTLAAVYIDGAIAWPPTTSTAQAPPRK